MLMIPFMRKNAASNRLKPVHVGSVQYEPGAPAFPMEEWTRVTVYLNYYDGDMHVWQNGDKVASASFSRDDPRLCQWHFGLYASGPNHDIVLYEDDIRIYKLNAPLGDLDTEPLF